MGREPGEAASFQPPRFEEENVVPFGIMQDGPGGPATPAGRFNVHKPLAADLFQCGREIIHFEEDHRLVAGGIRLDGFSLQTEETRAGIELRMVAQMLFAEL